jgi:hypothetical protein
LLFCEVEVLFPPRITKFFEMRQNVYGVGHLLVEGRFVETCECSYDNNQCGDNTDKTQIGYGITSEIESVGSHH